MRDAVPSKQIGNGHPAVLLLLALVAGCGEPSSTTVANKHDSKVATAPATPSQAACAQGAARLPATRLCPAEAAALLLAAPGPAAQPPSDCDWVVEEAALPGDRAVLYKAARCLTRVAKLSFVPGNPMSTLALAASPYEGAEDTGQQIARMVRATDRDAIAAAARKLVKDPREAARCRVRPAAIDGWPTDALVVDEVPQPRSDEVRTACGELGLDEDAQTFWRLSQGTGWFFQLGQESPIVDAGSFTLIEHAGNGKWQRVAW